MLFRSPGESNLAAFAMAGIFVLLLMLAIWDGREVYLRTDAAKEQKKEKTDGAHSLEEELDEGREKEEEEDSPTGKELEMERRMQLMDFNLTRQETEIALLLLDGAKDLNICSLLYISQNTLKYHLRNIYRKTGYSNRRELRENMDCA